MGYDTKYGRVTTERGSIGEFEPVVVFRAQDKLLPHLMRVYQIMCELAGSPQKHLDLIHDSNTMIKTWQATHHTQVPASANYIPPDGPQ